MHTVIKVSELALWKKIHGVPKELLQFKNISFFIFNATAESMKRSLSLKNLETHFCKGTCEKIFVKTIKNLPQHLSEKFIDYRYRFKKLRFVDYRYRPGLF